MAACAQAWPQSYSLTQAKTCHFLETIPFFRHNQAKSESRELFKQENVFLVEFSRFMNRKMPMLLKEFAESKRIFEIRNKLKFLDMESSILRGITSREHRSMREPRQDSTTVDPLSTTEFPDTTTMMFSTTPVNEDPTTVPVDPVTTTPAAEEDPETTVAPEELENPTLVGIASEVISAVSEAIQDGISTFDEVLEAAGEGVQTAVGDETWNNVCPVVWWPLQGEHCTSARCTACTPAVMSASLVCKRTLGEVSHRCVQRVMGEGACNFCIADFMA